MSEKIISIDEGATYEYLVHGLVTLVVLIALGPFIPILALIGLIAGIGLMATKSGIEVNVEDRLIRKYYRTYWVRYGKWMPLGEIKKVELKYNANSGEGIKSVDPLFMYMPVGIGRRDGTAKTYDLILTDDSDQEKLLNQFLKYNLARKVLTALSEIEGVEVKDHFGEKLKESMSRPRDARY